MDSYPEWVNESANPEYERHLWDGMQLNDKVGDCGYTNSDIAYGDGMEA